MTAKAIEVSLSSYLYLQNRCRLERLGKSLPDKGICHLTRSFNQFARDGFITLMDRDLGGAERGKWTSWSADEMSQMLDKEGLEWKPAEDVEYIAV